MTSAIIRPDARLQDYASRALRLCLNSCPTYRLWRIEATRAGASTR
jgi:predicted acetyltransferase